MEFKLKNPNKALLSYGYSLLALNLAALLLDKSGFATLNLTSFIIGLGLIVKILVLLWVPKAASSAGRNAIGWTTACFLSPSIGLIILGSMGIKYSDGLFELEKKYTEKFNEEKKNLNQEQASKKNDKHEYSSRLNQILIDLQDQACQEMPGILDVEDNAFLTEQLKNQGYVIDEDSDVFVHVDSKCPACGAQIEEKDLECPDCGLTL